MAVYKVNFNGVDEKRKLCLSTLCIYRNQEELDLDASEKSDKKAILIKNNNVSFDVLRKSIGETYTRSDIINFVEQQGANIFNMAKTQEEIQNKLEIEDIVDELTPEEIAENLAQAKVLQEKRIRYACNQEILSGYNSGCRGEIRKYPFKIEDQINQMSILQDIRDCEANSTLDSLVIAWKYNGQVLADIDWTPEQFKKLCADAKNFKAERIYTCQVKVTQIMNATTIEEVEQIVWTTL